MTPRQQAIAAGQRRYFTGMPCPSGHVSERTVDNSGCVACQDAIRAKNRESQREYSRAHYRANRNAYIARADEWGGKNPGKVKAAKIKWRRENKDAGNAASRDWQSRNPDRARENAYRWRRENPDQFKAIAINRRARVAANGGSISGEEIAAIVARQKGKCACCGARARLEMDHIIPVVLGGSSDASNFQGLCRSCNARKNAKHPIDFNRSRGLLL